MHKYIYPRFKALGKIVHLIVLASLLLSFITPSPTIARSTQTGVKSAYGPTGKTLSSTVYSQASVVNQQVSYDTIYMSFASKGTIGGVAYGSEDILAFDVSTGTWTKYFQGSNVGLGRSNINAFSLLPDGSILITLSSSSNI